MMSNVIKVIAAGVSFLVLIGGSVSSQQMHGTAFHTVPLKEFPKDRRFETVSGDPTKAGAIYVIRVHAERGYITMPHTHPQDEHIVVVKGSWSLAVGDKFDRHALEPMEVGTYALVPKQTPHFGQAKTDDVIHVYGIGPFRTHWLVPIYELTSKGILYETSANHPGVPTSASPPNCFSFKLGTRVRGGYGDGVIVAAQCTPGRLTQYRIEKSDGDRYWAQREELKTL